MPYRVISNMLRIQINIFISSETSNTKYIKSVCSTLLSLICIIKGQEITYIATIKSKIRKNNLYIT